MGRKWIPYIYFLAGESNFLRRRGWEVCFLWEEGVGGIEISLVSVSHLKQIKAKNATQG